MGNSQNRGEAPGPQQQERRGEDEPGRNMSYWEMAKVGYQELVNAIIRPPRASYEAEHLGPPCFEWHERFFERTDLELINPRGHRLACSHWRPVGDDGAPRPCLIYLHGNSSARVEAISQLALCFSIGATLFAFDFSGSGKSEGEWVSLGYWERDDLATVIAHLRASGRVASIALWGRSMGAVCALMHSSRDPSIAAMVCDSAFADLTQLAEELVDRARSNGLTVPGFVVSIVLRMVKNSVQKSAGFKLEDVAAINQVETSFVPTLFVAAEQDDFIASHHSSMLHEKYAGDKNLVLVEGDHNSPRPRFLFDSAAIFLQTYMKVPPSWAIAGADAFNNGVPPWIRTDSHGLNLADLGFEASDLDHHLGMTLDREARVQAALAGVFGFADNNTSSPDD
ncbi:hypothetical protein CTAYLR_001575 [Chrysophaeum taylorii]|uniref:Serine aminopeptidase S33 domain-containing protein n=1 Tax=Chrysophaeum taylorii TaxID=2483200 RepID=A0AAD7UDD4_9STRA|nr:hypothetical protein CTAYLR_001575 [Chrysophaeum taylorii]